MGVVSSMFTLITQLFVVPMLIHFLERVYGMSRLQGGCPLCGH